MSQLSWQGGARRLCSAYAWALLASTAYGAEITTQKGVVSGEIEGSVIQRGDTATNGGMQSVSYAVIEGQDVVAISASGVQVRDGGKIQEFSCIDASVAPAPIILPEQMKRRDEGIARGQGLPFLHVTKGSTLKCYIRSVEVSAGARTIQTHPILDKIYANEFAGAQPPLTAGRSAAIGSIQNGNFEPVIRVKTASGMQVIRPNEL